MTFLRFPALIVVALIAACDGDPTGPLEAVANVAVTASRTELLPTETVQLAARPLTSTGGVITGRTATWSSSDEAVARVDASGLVTASAAGTASISATVGEATGSIQLVVRPVPVADIDIAPLGAPLAAGTTVTLVATARDSAGTALPGRTFEWQSSDTRIATVSQTGQITGLAPGSVTITASTGNRARSLSVNVVVGAAASISLDATMSRLFVGGERRVDVSVRDVLGNRHASPAITWTSSNSGIVELDQSGKIRTVRSGSANVIASIGTVSDTLLVQSLAATMIVLGDYHGCALADSGEAFCWGKNSNGELGAVPAVVGADTSLVPVPVSGGLRFRSLHGGPSHTCGLTESGDAYCWGSNSTGQLGDGSQTSRFEPVKLVAPIPFTSLALNRQSTLGLTGQGEIYEAVIGSIRLSTTPLPMKLLSDGGRCTVGIDDTVWCGSLRPQTNARFQSMSAGQASITATYTCGLTVDRLVYCWQINVISETALGISVPLLVDSTHQFRSIATAFQRTCGVTDANRAFCRGVGSEGELGDGERHLTPTQQYVEVVPGVAGITSFKSIATGRGSTCVISQDGAPACWGLGPRTGTGQTATLFSPVPLAAIK